MQICRGSMEYPNLSCPFKNLHKATNKVDFTKKKTCSHCTAVASEIKCSARKYVENDRCNKRMKVVYIAVHTCQPRVQERKPDKSHIENAVGICLPTMSCNYRPAFQIPFISWASRIRQLVYLGHQIHTGKNVIFQLARVKSGFPSRP